MPPSSSSSSSVQNGAMNSVSLEQATRKPTKKKPKKKTTPLFRRLGSGIRSASPHKRSRNKQTSAHENEDERDETIMSSSIKTEILSSITTISKVHNSYSEPNKEETPRTLVSKSTDTTAPLDSESSSTFWRTFFCGSSTPYSEVQEDDSIEIPATELKLLARQNLLPEDPTVEESIECIFANQLKAGLEFGDVDNEHNEAHARAVLQRQSSSTLVHVGTFDPNISHNDTEESDTSLRLIKPDEPQPSWPAVVVDEPSSPTTISTTTTTTGCCCKSQKTPILEPCDWPQAPLLLRPTPNSGTRVRGIRFANSTQYLWSPDDNPETPWPQALQEHWNTTSSPKSKACDFSSIMCEECMVLPINNGKEPEGESLVIDFVSQVFCGTMLIRIRDTHGTSHKSTERAVGYFDGMNRRYQVVMSGKFLKDDIDMSTCSAGLVMDRPLGKLPPKWIVKGGLKVVMFFAPQLQVQMTGPHPSSVTPLGSTPQVLRVESCDPANENNHDEYYRAPESIEGVQEEPVDASKTLLGVASDASHSLQRARYRKRQVDKMVVDKQPIATNSRSVYTFEFLQHMLSFTEFSVELGSIFGSVPLCEALDGQPLQIMAMTEQHAKLWSFDVWHESLVEDAKRHEAAC